MRFETASLAETDGETLARRMLAEETGLSPAALRIRRAANGKPFVENAPVCFSISHSGGLVLCAVHDKPVGADIEKITLRPAVMRRVCTPAECAYIGDDAVRFTEVWTRKEAFSKLDGRGLSIGLISVPTADGGGLFPRVCGCTVKTAVLGDYVLSIVWKD